MHTDKQSLHEINTCKSLESFPGEEWKDVVDYEGIYQVSNLGRVKSLDRVMHDCLGRPHTYKSKVLTGCLTSDGYLLVGLSKDNTKPKGIAIHRLVAQAFLKDWNTDLEVDHRNTLKIDNRAENLRMVTHKENIHLYYLEQETIDHRIKETDRKRHLKKQYWTPEKRRELSERNRKRFEDPYAKESYSNKCKVRIYGIHTCSICSQMFFAKSAQHKYCYDCISITSK